MTRPTRAIGGYFGLQLVAPAAPAVASLPSWWIDGVAVQSGRVALALALPARPATLWLPAYFCPPVARALARTGWDLRRYGLAEDWGPGEDVTPAPGDRILVVDFFGLSASAVRRAVARFGADRVVADHSLALFAAPLDGVPTTYSPRKFVGLPDGGLLSNGDAVELAAPDETLSAGRTRHLLLRAAGDLQSGRIAFSEAEASLDADLVPRAMSLLTRRLLEAVDVDAVASRRVRNFDRLVSGLRALGFDVPRRSPDAVPLCCPVFGLRPTIARPLLASNGIFCAAYWPDVALEVEDVEGRRFAEATTFLPCDQRYDDDDIDFVLERIEALEDHR